MSHMSLSALGIKIHVLILTWVDSYHFASLFWHLYEGNLALEVMVSIWYDHICSVPTLASNACPP